MTDVFFTSTLLTSTVSCIRCFYLFKHRIHATFDIQFNALRYRYFTFLGNGYCGYTFMKLHKICILSPYVATKKRKVANGYKILNPVKKWVLFSQSAPNKGSIYQISLNLINFQNLPPPPPPGHICVLHPFWGYHLISSKMSFIFRIYT